jgi:anti-sigma factor RsiW
MIIGASPDPPPQGLRAMVNCQEFGRVLYDFVAKELPAERREEIDHHLAECPACRSALKQYEQTIHLAGSLPPTPTPPTLLERFKAALKNDLSPTKPDRD